MSAVRALAVVLLSTLLPGCASIIYGTHPYLAVDSQPRGYELHLSEDRGDAVVAEADAVTPFVHRLALGPRDQISLRLAGSQLTQAFPCPVRWGGSVATNAAFAALFGTTAGVLVYLGAQGIDYLTGAMRECDSPLVLAVPASESGQLSRYCRRLILLPPLDLDTHLSDRLAKAIQKRYGRGETGCDTFVDYQEAKEQLEYLNISHYSRGNLSDIDHQRLYRLAYAMHATHFMASESAARSSSEGRARGKLIDVQTMLPERDYDVDLRGEFTAPPQPPTSRKLYIYSLSLLPNALTYSHETSFRLTEGASSSKLNIGEASSHRVKSRGVDLLSGFALEHVDHPDGLAPWDYSTGISPSFKMLLWDSAYTFDDPSAATGTSSYLLHMRYFFFLVTGTVTLHTPFGALSLDLSYGPVLGTSYDDHGNTGRSAFTANNVDIYYTAFLSGRLFLRFGVDLLSFNKSALVTPAYRVGGYNETYIGFGLFLPTTRSHAIEVLDGG